MSNQVVLEPAASLEIGVDLAPLAKRWQGMGILHRVAEDAGKQVIYATPQDKSVIQQEVRGFLSGSLTVGNGQSSFSSDEAVEVSQFDLSQWVRQAPVTVILIVLSTIGFLLTEFGLETITDLLVIQAIDYSGAAQRLNLPAQISINEYLAHGHYWRLVTPIFLHFGWVHLVFNMLWTWELGRRIEQVMGSMHLLMLVMFIGIASNLYQTFATPLAYFGGMSGVIYGLLAYCGVFTVIAPHKSLHMPVAIYALMLGSLAIGYSGIFDFLARMANTAHLMGLVFGILIAVPAALIYRFIK